MTAPAIDLNDLQPEPAEIPVGIPDHTARSGRQADAPIGASGETGNGRPGIFGGQRRGPGRPRGSVSKPKAAKESPPKLSAAMRGQLKDLYSGIGAMLKPFDEFTGQTIIDQADKCADSVYELAQTNDSVRRFVIGLTTTSVMGAVIFAHLPILLALMRHSSNERVKAGAGMAYMGLKMSGDDDLAKMFGQKPAEDSE